MKLVVEIQTDASSVQAIYPVNDSSLSIVLETDVEIGIFHISANRGRIGYKFIGTKETIDLIEWTADIL